MYENEQTPNTIFIAGTKYDLDSITEDGQTYIKNVQMVQEKINDLQIMINIMNVSKATFEKELIQEAAKFTETKVSE